MAPMPPLSSLSGYPSGQTSSSITASNTTIILARVFQDQTNVLKPNDREMIVEFLNGRLRVNPRDSSAPLHRIILNESRTKEAHNPTRTTIEQIVFEMNFASGHWRKLRRKAVVRDNSIMSVRRRSKDGMNNVSELSFDSRALDRDGNPISEDEEETVSWMSECGR